MAVQVKTHVAYVVPMVQPNSDIGVAENLQPGAVPIELWVFFERVSPGEHYMKYGVELSDPAYIQCEVAEAGYFQPDSEVIVAGRSYRVVGNPEIHEMGLMTDHADITLQFKQYSHAQQ